MYSSAACSTWIYFFSSQFSSMCHLVNAVSLTMAATATFLLPWITNTDVLWGAYIVLGTTIGLIDIGKPNVKTQENGNIVS